MNDAKGSAGGSYAVLRVENAGPIAKGEVHLRPLTVFTGPGNTGKSWFATLAYAVMNEVVFNRALLDLENLKNDDEFRGTFLEHADVWARQACNREPVDFTENDWRKLKSIMEMAYTKGYCDYIQRCFGLSEMGDLIRKGAGSDMRIEMRSRPGETGEMVCELKLGELESDGKWRCSVSLPDRGNFLEKCEDFIPRLRSRLRYCVPTGEEGRRYPVPQSDRAGIVNSISRALRGDTPGTTWYLPGGRGGIIRAHKAIDASFLDDDRRYDPCPRSGTAPMSGIHVDFLRNLAWLSTADSEVGRHEIRAKRERKINARNMENRMLEGQVKLEKSAAKFPCLFWMPDGWDKALALANASSMVTELAPVVLYLRHFVDPGELFVLEEPEAHLHPSMQIEFARLIAEWACAGIRVILITHSEWILEEISNLVGEACRNPGNGLPEDRVGVWSFGKGEQVNGGGSVIREVEWNIDEGGYETGTEDAAAEQHNRWIEIMNGAGE